MVQNPIQLLVLSEIEEERPLLERLIDEITDLEYVLDNLDTTTRKLLDYAGDDSFRCRYRFEGQRQKEQLIDVIHQFMSNHHDYESVMEDAKSYVRDRFILYNQMLDECQGLGLCKDWEHISE